MAFSLSFSGGGCRCAAHIGVLKALSEHGLYPSAISGTSAGAIAAALFACGNPTDRLIEICRELKKHGSLLLDWNISGIITSALLRPFLGQSTLSGILRGKRLYSFLDMLFGDASFEDLKLPLFVAATDLVSGNTISFSQIKPIYRLTDTVWISNALLKDAVYSSCCLPSVFTPLKTPFGFVVDGGVTDNLPVDLLFAAGFPNIVAVDLSDTSPDVDINGLFEIAYRSVSVMGSRLQKCCVRGERLNIKPKLPPGAGVFSFDMLEQCIEAGYSSAIELIPIIEKL